MSAQDIAYAISYGVGLLETGLGFVALFFIIRSKTAREYWPLLALIAVRSTSSLFLIPWARFAGHILGARPAYFVYFYVYWISFGIESIFAVLTIYYIYKSAMAPLQGLQSLGLLVFKWAAAISTALAFGIAITPGATQHVFLIAAVSQMQRATSILTLSLLLFVCFAIRPMGLSYRSRIFGVSLGLGMLSTVNMIQSAWLANPRKMYEVFSLVNSVAALATVAIWIFYFAVPEPKRRFILLPTTSPFLRWNQISELLGHNPGYVAVGGFSPESFSPAELEIMRRASKKMGDVTSIASTASNAA